MTVEVKQSFFRNAFSITVKYIINKVVKLYLSSQVASKFSNFLIF